MIISKHIVECLRPTRLMEKGGDIQDEKLLLDQEESGVYYNTSQKYCVIRGQGYLLLDFGQELHGGVRILTNIFPAGDGGRIRIRFGESVGEACSNIEEKHATNHHSLRDFIIFMPHMGDQTFGQTGFRFVRLDFLDDVEYHVINIYAAYCHRDMEKIGSFVSDDPILNRIYDVSEHTLFLNCQDNLIEGVKRDRMVWIDDMQPEVQAYSYLYTDTSIIENGIKDSLRNNPLPRWLGNIPANSFWLLPILRDYWRGFDKKDIVAYCWPYVLGSIKQLSDCVDDEGTIDFNRIPVKARPGFFFDWPTHQKPDAEMGNRYLFLFALSAYQELVDNLSLEPSPYVDSLCERLTKKKEDPHAKEVVALGYLTGQVDAKTAKERLFEKGAHGLCTYISFFIFKAMCRLGSMEETLAILKEYYGAMLDRGATSFFEMFDMDWLEGSGRIDERTKEGEKDFHGDFGVNCYSGYRRSLCHGWSVGPLPFLVEEVLGYRREGNVVSFTPNLGHLRFVRSTIPTPYGTISVHIENGKVEAQLPQGLVLKNNF